MIMGVALKPNVPSSSQGSAADKGSLRAIFGFATDTGTEIASVRLDTSEAPYINNTVGVTTKALDTAGFTHPITAWNYYELRVKINGASGEVELKINGVQAIATYTMNLGSTNIGSVFLQGFVVNQGTTEGNIFDDIYVVDTSTTPNNTFLGDCRVDVIVPSGAGNQTNFTPSAGANYAAVDDLTVNDGDTTTVSSSVVGDVDLYTFGDLSASSAQVFAVSSCIYAKKSDAGARSVASVIRQGGTDYVGTSFALATGYAVYEQVRNQDPTGSAWTVTNVNGDQFGLKTSA
jgi:hypothetical protein